MKENKMSFRKTLMIATLGLIGLLSCVKKENKEDTIRSLPLITTNTPHILEARKFVKSVHGCSYASGDCVDFDKDNVCDFYVIAGEGSIYHTKSQRLTQGEDTDNKRMWYKRIVEGDDPILRKILYGEKEGE